MRKGFFEYVKTSLRDFFQATVNIVIFLPYFFSIIPLLNSLFSPWKNLVINKKNQAFSLSEWFNRQSFNAISRIIGFFMRIIMILFYILFQVFLVAIYPFIVLTAIILIPLAYINTLFQPTEEEMKNRAKVDFLNTHLTNEKNRPAVEKWFDDYYRKTVHKKKWWDIANLFSYPPMARDWAVGFTPVVDNYTTDLTNPASQNNIKTIVGRQKEIDEIERILAKSDSANVVIVGDEGVGKHTIVDALAKKLYEGQTVSQLLYKRILKMNMEKILSETTDQKQREKLFEDLIDEAAAARNVILFIDNLDRYIASESGRIDLTSAIEKYTRNNSLSIIGIATTFFYEKYLVYNDVISRFFNKVEAKEVSKAFAVDILLDVAFTYEKRYAIDIPYEILQEVIDKSDYFITNIPFPEKAVDLLDSVCLFAKKLHHRQILSQDVDMVIGEKTHVPTILTATLKKKLVDLEPYLSKRIIDQPEAIRNLCSALQRSFILIGLRKKPLASFLFLGPTGVGKTATAKALSQVFFGSEKNLLRFDMSEYQAKTDIPKLIGAPESGNPGLMTVAIREKPYGVLLLDELEKADHDLVNIFLTVCDEGYFTDGFGKKVDCKNLVIIATSNAPKVEEAFSPEFLNRFDGVITYRPLSTGTVVKIARIMVDEINTNIKKLHHITLLVADSYLNGLADRSYNMKYGARDMQRLIRQEIEDKVAKMLLSGTIKAGDTVRLT